MLLSSAQLLQDAQIVSARSAKESIHTSIHANAKSARTATHPTDPRTECFSRAAQLISQSG